MDEIVRQMRDCVLRHADTTLGSSLLPNLSLGVLRRAIVPELTMCEPMICIVLQGAKQVQIGAQLLRYDVARCFVSTIEVPATGCVIQAHPNNPYVAVGLKLDRGILTTLIRDSGVIPDERASFGFGVAQVSIDFLESLKAYLALLDTPRDIPVLASSREREILYRLLQSEHGQLIWQLVREESQLSRVRRAMDWIRRHFDETLRTEVLAEIAGMSVPSFFRNFKATTSMSPLQYQKTVRLHAARRLLLTNVNSTHAAFAVGYESASQFSREYSRLFGMSPSRDVAKMRV